jgi:hypothetical protein
MEMSVHKKLISHRLLPPLYLITNGLKFLYGAVVCGDLPVAGRTKKAGAIVQALRDFVRQPDFIERQLSHFRGKRGYVFIVKVSQCLFVQCF